MQGFTQLPNPIELTSGLSATLSLSFMPTPRKDGSFPMLVGQSQPDIEVAFQRGGKVLGKCAWNDAISAEAPFALSDGSSVSPDDRDDLDELGWDVLLKYGLFPTAFSPM